MTAIRHIGRILVVAGALALPTVASAEQAPSELCGGEKAEGKETTAEKSQSKKEADKPQDSSKDSTDANARERESEKS
jgi:hypothetical protein